MPQFDVAVIIVNWNSEEMLSRCLQHLQGQSLKPKRVIIMDNNSDDDSLKICQEKFPEYEYHQLGANLGFAVANNKAVELVADCTWVALINPDAYAKPHWLEKLQQATEKHPEVSVFSSLMLDHKDESIVDGAGDVYHTGGLAWRRYHGKKLADLQLKEEEVFGPCGGAALYKREVFLEAGKFDEGYFCYFEDVDLAFRMQIMGQKCLFIPEAIVSHVGSGITAKLSDFALIHGHRNLEWSFFKNMPTPLLFLYLPFHFLVILISLVYFTAQGKPQAILKAKWLAIKGFGKALRKRKAVQNSRKINCRDLRRIMAKGLSFMFSR